MTITEFLEARIAEDEAVARAASTGPWFRDSGWSISAPAPEGWDGPYVVVETPRARNDSEFVARHNPARVLAECAAKRAIIKQREAWPVLVEKKPEFSEAAADIQSMTYRMTQEMVWLSEREYAKRFGVEAPTAPMIRTLAAIYSEHPDYRQEWAL